MSAYVGSSKNLKDLKAFKPHVHHMKQPTAQMYRGTSLVGNALPPRTTLGPYCRVLGADSFL